MPKAALRGALDLIAQAGGGEVEGYPRETRGEKMTASHLYNVSGRDRGGGL